MNKEDTTYYKIKTGGRTHLAYKIEIVRQKTITP